jgi:hypothetical protein
MIEFIKKIKARTIFSGMIYITWCIAIVMSMLKGFKVPDILNNIVLMQMTFYYGSKVQRDREVS